MTDNNHMTEPNENVDQEFKPDINNSEAASSIDAEVLSLRNENADLKDRLLRTIADMENLKKRTEKDKLDTIKFSQEKLMQDLIPLIDIFASTMHGMKSAENLAQNKAIIDGMELVFKQLLSALKKHGLEMHESKLKPFDPNLHQAIQKLEDPEAKEEIVKEVFGEAFTLHGRLIRPAMVVVAVPASN